MMPASCHKIFHDEKVCVIMPTYNNAQTLAKVLGDVLQHTDQVIVVNDGSTDNTLKLLNSFSSVTLVTYDKNKGKGYALRKGFKRAVELGYKYAISIDSDGQHDAQDLPVFLEKIVGSPGSIVIGVRNMDQESVPGKSSFGNKFSNFWFYVETGITLKDTQSGYRCYPLYKLGNFSWITRKYEFEIEVLVRAAWQGVEIQQVPVKVFYPPREKRISHFRPFKDFTRISILNTFLVLVAFLYIKPRNFVRSFKKKNSFLFYRSTCLIPRRATGSRQSL